MVGFVQDTKKQSTMTGFSATCFFGKQISKLDIEKSDLVIDKEQNFKINKIKRHGRSNLMVDHKPSDSMDILISTINSQKDLGWKADTCLLQENHSDHPGAENC
jgi:hypothetical protein